jgi:hypothetical protein
MTSEVNMRIEYDEGWYGKMTYPWPLFSFSIAVLVALGRLTVVDALTGTEEDDGRCDDALRGVMDCVFLLLPKKGIMLFFLGRLAGRGGTGGWSSCGAVTEASPWRSSDRREVERRRNLSESSAVFERRRLVPVLWRGDAPGIREDGEEEDVIWTEGEDDKKNVRAIETLARQVETAMTMIWACIVKYSKLSMDKEQFQEVYTQLTWEDGTGMWWDHESSKRAGLNRGKNTNTSVSQPCIIARELRGHMAGGYRSRGETRTEEEEEEEDWLLCLIRSAFIQRIIQWFSFDDFSDDDHNWSFHHLPFLLPSCAAGLSLLLSPCPPPSPLPLPFSRRVRTEMYIILENKKYNDR